MTAADRATEINKTEKKLLPESAAYWTARGVHTDEDLDQYLIEEAEVEKNKPVTVEPLRHSPFAALAKVQVAPQGRRKT